MSMVKHEKARSRSGKVRRNKARKVGVHELVDCFVAIQSVLLSSYVSQSRVQVKDEFLICG